mmetsp:Transcript_24422/g.59263  ORF Transcript_24422/g.59263 Transcript_24422/m.59263 type:complete len:202 (-) Transcript_24422:21-626(-)
MAKRARAGTGATGRWWWRCQGYQMESTTWLSQCASPTFAPRGVPRGSSCSPRRGSSSNCCGGGRRRRLCQRCCASTLSCPPTQRLLAAFAGGPYTWGGGCAARWRKQRQPTKGTGGCLSIGPTRWGRSRVRAGTVSAELNWREASLLLKCLLAIGCRAPPHPQAALSSRVVEGGVRMGDAACTKPCVQQRSLQSPLPRPLK